MPRRHRRAPGRVLLADDNADMRDYVRRLLADQHYAVEAVADGEAALGRDPRGSAGPGADRRDDAGARRLWPAAGVARRSDDCAISRFCCCRRAPARKRGSRALTCRRRRLSDQAVFRPANCWRASARIYRWRELRREAMEALRARERSSSRPVLATVPAGVWFTHDRNARRITEQPAGGGAAASCAGGSGIFGGRGMASGPKIRRVQQRGS